MSPLHQLQHLKWTTPQPTHLLALPSQLPNLAFERLLCLLQHLAFGTEGRLRTALAPQLPPHLAQLPRNYTRSAVLSRNVRNVGIRVFSEQIIARSMIAHLVIDRRVQLCDEDVACLQRSL